MSYTNFIMDHNLKNSFINRFEEKWQERISTFPEPFNSNYQLIGGSRMRPLLAAWGYFVNITLQEDTSFPVEFFDVCFSIELLHKSSIIIDDLIDGDIKRKGKDTFHSQFGNNEAILFSLFLIGTSFKSVSLSDNNEIQQDLSDTLIQMSTGALSEINLSSENIFDLKKVKKIIDQQTSSLIKSSYYLGFLNSKKDSADKKHLDNYIKNIGSMCGFLFQMLNDLEPFSSSKKNADHKGEVNFDIYNSRKNYVISFLYGYSSKKDQKILNNLLSMDNIELSQKTLFNLIEKYKIEDEILRQASEIHSDLLLEIKKLEDYTDHQYVFEFTNFVNHIIEVSKNKLVY